MKAQGRQDPGCISACVHMQNMDCYPLAFKAQLWKWPVCRLFTKTCLKWRSSIAILDYQRVHLRSFFGEMMIQQILGWPISKHTCAGPVDIPASIRSVPIAVFTHPVAIEAQLAAPGERLTPNMLSSIRLRTCEFSESWVPGFTSSK